MGLEIAIELLKSVFINTTFVGSSWIYQLMFLFGSLIIITRNYKDWAALALPVITGWHYIGFGFNQIFFLIAGLVFLVDVLSLKTIETGITTAIEKISTRKERRFQEVKRKMNIKEEMETFRERYSPLGQAKALGDKRLNELEQEEKRRINFEKYEPQQIEKREKLRRFEERLGEEEKESELRRRVNKLRIEREKTIKNMMNLQNRPKATRVYQSQDVTDKFWGYLPRKRKLTKKRNDD